MLIERHRIWLFFLVLVVLACGTEVRAQTDTTAFPSKTIRFIVPSSPGGGIDILARQFADKLQAQWNQPVIVENRPGANGTIGTIATTSSLADGYTLLITNSALMQNVHLRPSDAFKLSDLAPVSMIALAPPALAIHASIRAASLSEFVALVKAAPSIYSFGSFGAGSSGHLLGEMLNKAAGLDMVHIPYKGESPAVNDLLSGQISAMFGSAGSMSRQSPGKIRLLAVASPKRLSGFPDLPTFAEVGFPELNVPGFIAVFAPAATPPEIVQKLSDAIVALAAQPDMRDKVMNAGFEPYTMGASEFSVRLKTFDAQWGEIVVRTGVKLE